MDLLLITEYYPGFAVDLAYVLGFVVAVTVAIAVIGPFLQRSR